MKDPAFLFYPGDYLRDTQNLSEASQVAYDRIMCEHMRNNCIAKKQFKFFTKRLSEDEIEELLYILTETESGYKIEWVVDSIFKRKSYTESRRNNRKKGSSERTHIYLIKDMKSGNVKIGNSVNPERRLIELKNQLHKDLVIVCYSNKIQQKNESELHKHFEDNRINGEWFSVNESDIINHMIHDMNINLEYHMNNHMENENENEIEEGKEEEKKPTKHKHGEFKRVLLTDEEYSRLETEWGASELDSWIQRLDEYLENNRKKKYANHNLTLRKWKRDEKPEIKKSSTQGIKIVQYCKKDEHKYRQLENDGTCLLCEEEGELG